MIDANVLFAILIRKGVTAAIFFHPNIKLHSSIFLFEELEKYFSILLKKTHRSLREFNDVLETIRRKIALIDIQDSYKELAAQCSPDPKDILYLALALQQNIPLWSNDKALKNQDMVNVYSTHDLLKIIQ